MISFKITLQRFGLSKINLYVANQEANVPKHFFSSTLSVKKVFVLIVFGMMNIWEEYIKNEKF